MKSYIINNKIIFFSLLIVVILSSCTNYSSFSKRKYLPYFKKQTFNQEVFVKNYLSNYEQDTFYNKVQDIVLEIDSNEFNKEPILFAQVSDVKYLNNQNKLTRQFSTTPRIKPSWNSIKNLKLDKDFYSIKTSNIPEETTDKKRLSLFAKILYLALMLYFFFLIPLLIYLIEGKNTTRYKTSLKLLLIYLGFCVTWLFVFFFAFIFSFLLALFAFNFSIFMNILLVATIIIYALSIYLGIKTIIKN